MTDFAAADSFQGPDQLRDAYKRAVARVKELEGTIETLQGDVRGFKITKAGFPEGSEAYRLLADFYDGDIGDIDGLKAFAAKYGHKPGESQTPAPAAPADEIENGDRLAGELGGSAQPVTPVKDADKLKAEIAKAESEGRLRDAISMKNRLMAMTVKR